MNNPLNMVLYGAYLFWKSSFYGIRDETSDKEVLFNIVCSIVLFSLLTCFVLLDIYITLFKKVEITSNTLKGYEILGTTIILSIPLLIFLFLFSKRNKYIIIFRNLEKIRIRRHLSLIFWIIYMIIPIVLLILI